MAYVLVFILGTWFGVIIMAVLNYMKSMDEDAERHAQETMDRFNEEEQYLDNLN